MTELVLHLVAARINLRLSKEHSRLSLRVHSRDFQVAKGWGKQSQIREIEKEERKIRPVTHIQGWDTQDST